VCVCLSPSVCVSVCLCVESLSVCMSVSLSVCVSVCVCLSQCSVSTEAIFHRASRKGAKDEAKPAGSEQRALGSKKANTRKQLAKIKQQQAVRNQPLRLGFLKSDLPTAYCYLPTGFPLRAWRLGANNLVEVVMLNILSVRM